jgi:hypothetical protein
VSDQHHRRDRVRTSPAVSKEVVSPSNNALDVRCDHIVFPSDAINARSRLINSIALCEDGINDSMHHMVANVITTPTSTSNIEHQTAYAGLMCQQCQQIARITTTNIATHSSLQLVIQYGNVRNWNMHATAPALADVGAGCAK